MAIQTRWNNRVLLVNDHFRFGGGGDTVFAVERRFLESAGWEVFTFSKEEQRPAGAGPGDRIHMEDGRRWIRKAAKFSFNFNVYRELKRFIRQTRPSLVHLHLISKYPSSVYAALAGVPVIQTLHGPNLFCATGWGCRKRDLGDCECGIGVKCHASGCIALRELLLHWSSYLVNRYLARKHIHLFICPSKHLRRTTADLGYTPAVYVPLFVEPWLAELPLDRPVGPPTVLFAGALLKQKGLDVLLEAFKQLRIRLPEAKLIIAGRRSEHYEQMAVALGIAEHVSFLGFVEHRRMGEFFLKGDVFVMPSIWKEQFGLVGVEALAAGLPCVGSDIGGIPEWLVDGEHGFLVPPGDPVALADRLHTLLSRPELRKDMAVRGREHVTREFGMDSFRKSTMEIVRGFARA